MIGPYRPLPYIIEPMTLADVDQVMEIERIAFPTPWSARAYRYEITHNEYGSMIVLRPATRPQGALGRFLRHFKLAPAGPILGYAGFWLLVDEAHICTIAVHPHWRGRGLGELLLLSLLDRGQEQGARLATLEVRVSNQAAQDLYHKIGFHVVSVRHGYYSDNGEDAYIMTTAPFDTPDFQANLDQRRSRLFARLRADAAGQTAGRTLPAA
jgi:ribosomal-protein-alanine N-acetyltransferase